MMRLLLVNQFFHPDLAATAQIATELAEDLAERGWTVTALAGRGRYLGGHALERESEHCGIRIVRAPATSFGKETLLHRGLDYASFFAGCAVELARLPVPDVILSLSTPPLISAIAVASGLLRRVPVVYWVQDLYPEVAAAFGALSPASLPYRAMKALSRVTLAKSDRVVVLGEAMRERVVEAGARADRTFVIPNWSDGAHLRPVPHAANPARKELAAPGQIIVMYSGNIGRAHDFETLAGAIRDLRKETRIKFVFVGDGAWRPALHELARDCGNIELLPYQSRERLRESLSAADVHLVTLSNAVAGLLEPSKLYGVMAVGRPCAFVGPRTSEVARTIDSANCGAVIDNGDSRSLSSFIRQLVEDESLRETLGDNARVAFEAKYTRSVATARFDILLRSLVDRRN